MKVASWNVNSIKARAERFWSFVDRTQPDVVCLQELKVVDDVFPHDAARTRGYACAVYGQRAYNGVAILSRLPLGQITRGFGDGGDESQARFISVEVDDVLVASCYVPNGKEVGSDKFVYKKEWLARLSTWVSGHRHASLLLCGDFNVAPADLDVSVPERWGTSVLCHEDIRGAYGQLLAQSLTDLWRQAHPSETAYSWWDYRALSFARNEGLRIDLMLASPDVAARCTSVSIERNERKGLLPSDHVPVMAELD